MCLLLLKKMASQRSVHRYIEKDNKKYSLLLRSQLHEKEFGMLLMFYFILSHSVLYSISYFNFRFSHHLKRPKWNCNEATKNAPKVKKHRVDAKKTKISASSNKMAKDEEINKLFTMKHVTF